MKVKEIPFEDVRQGVLDKSFLADIEKPSFVKKDFFEIDNLKITNYQLSKTFSDISRSPSRG